MSQNEPDPLVPVPHFENGENKVQRDEMDPKSQREFSAAKVESRPLGSQHTSHSFFSNNGNSCFMFP